MKLRISGNSLRLRLLRPEVETLRGGTRLEEKLYLTSDEGPSLTYALERDDSSSSVSVSFRNGVIVVALPGARVEEWAGSEQVGIDARLDLGDGRVLTVLVEKDFACLDRSDADNAGTFDHPKAGLAC